MHYTTRRKIKDSAAIGGIIVPVAALVRMASNSEHAFSRAGKTSAALAAVGGVVGGSLGYRSYKEMNSSAWDDNALESTLYFGVFGSVLAAATGGLASLARSAMKPS